MTESKAITKLVLLLTGVCTILSAVAVAPALPAIAKHFNNSPLVPWILMASNFAMMAVAPLFGKVVGKLGPLKTLRGGLLVYVLLGCGAYLLDSVQAIIASRVLFAVGVVSVMVCLNVLVASYFQGEERKAFIGYQGFVASMISLAVIQAAGTLSGMQWNLPFLLYGYGLVVLALSFLLPSPQPMAPPPGAGAAASNEPAPSAFTGGVVRTLVTLVAAMMAYYVAMLYVPFLTKDVGGTPDNIGTAMVIMTLSGALAAFGFGWLKLAPNAIYVLAFGLVAAGYALLSQAGTPSAVFLGIGVAGLGLGLMLPNSTAKLMALAHPATIPTVMSFLVVCMFGGNAVGGAIGQQIQARVGTPQTFLITAGACALVAVVYLLLGLRRKSAPAPV